MITYIEALHKYKKLDKCYFCNIKAEENDKTLFKMNKNIKIETIENVVQIMLNLIKNHFNKYAGQVYNEALICMIMETLEREIKNFNNLHRSMYLVTISPIIYQFDLTREFKLTITHKLNKFDQKSFLISFSNTNMIITEQEIN